MFPRSFLEPLEALQECDPKGNLSCHRTPRCNNNGQARLIFANHRLHQTPQGLESEEVSLYQCPPGERNLVNSDNGAMGDIKAFYVIFSMLPTMAFILQTVT